MPSALRKYANSILTVPIAVSGGWNDTTLQYDEATSYLTYKALVEYKAIDSEDTSAAIDINTMQVKGRIVDPVEFDSRIRFPITCTLELIREKQKGRIEISLIPFSPYFQEQKLLGSAFIGTLVYS